MIGNWAASPGVAILVSFEAVDRGAGTILETPLQPVDRALEPVEAALHCAPAGGRQIDEEREVIDPCPPFGVQVALEALQAPDRLSREASDLGEVPRHRKDLRAHALPNRASEALRHRGLELGGAAGELVEGRARAFECRGEIRVDGCATAGFLEAFASAVEGVGIHAPDCSLRVGRSMRTEELDYDLPPELVAQRPLERRDASRLLVYERATGAVRHRSFTDLPEELGGRYLVVVNDTRVVPARLHVRRPGGEKAELLLLEPHGDGVWEALARPSRRLRPGMRLSSVELLDALGDGRWRVRIEGTPAGEAPLPPYITEPLGDPERYQTVYAAEEGSAAAPTAGLHFTPELLSRLDVARLTLHVGLDTFRPVSAEILAEHEIYSERYAVEPAARERIRTAERVCAVGTTSVRVLESLARGAPAAGRTDLFVTPGFEFRRVDALVTNFHLPRSTLLALVMAFAGAEETRRLYGIAIEERYRFYSFGDAMLVL